MIAAPLLLWTVCRNGLFPSPRRSPRPWPNRCRTGWSGPPSGAPIRPTSTCRGCGAPRNPDHQAIVGLAPDLVVANREENRRIDVERLRTAVIPKPVDKVAEVLHVAALVGADGHTLDVFGHGGPHHFVDRAVVAEMHDLRPLGLEEPPHDVDGGVVPVEQAGRGHESHRVSRPVEVSHGATGTAPRTRPDRAKFTLPVLVKDARILRDGIEQPPKRRPRLSVHRVSVGRRRHIWPSGVDLGVDRECSLVHTSLAFDNLAIRINQDEIRDSNVPEPHPEWVNPKVIGQLGISGCDVPSNPFVESKS
jgi:hypothetical protein